MTQTEKTKHQEWEPRTLDGTLTLLPGGTGSIAIGEHPAAAAWRATWRGITLGPVTVRRAGTKLFWPLMHLDIRDTNGDGWLDSGTGLSKGVTWQSGGGDYFPSVNARAVATFEPDRDPPSVTLGVGDPWPGMPWLGTSGQADVLLPTDELVVRFSEPVLASTVVKHLQVRAASRPVTGKISEGADDEPFATTFTFTPDLPLPHGAELSLSLAGIADVTGAKAVAGGPALRVAADPGSLTANPGFERDLAGWAARGKARSAGAHEGVAPVAGSRQAIVEGQGQIVGYVDVPATASRLEFSMSAVIEGGGDKVATVRLRSGSARVLVFSLGSADGNAAALRTIAIDLTPFRGRRVYIEIQSAEGNFWQAQTTLLVDNVTIR